MLKGKDLGITAIITTVLAIISFFYYYGEYLWFNSLGYTQLFTKILTYKILLFITGVITSTIILYASYKWVIHNIQKFKTDYKPSKNYKYIILITSVLIGTWLISQWPTILKAINATPFPTADPIFSLNIGFYVFTLPFYNLIIEYLTIILIIIIISNITLYLYHYGTIQQEAVEPQTQKVIKQTSFEFQKFKTKIKEHANLHTTILTALAFLIFSAYIYLSKYHLMFSPQGTVFGIGFTEQHVLIPLYNILTIIALTAAILIMLNLWLKINKLKYWLTAILITTLIIGLFSSFIVQSYIVEPDELNKERPYLENEIKQTREAYNLEKVQSEQFPADQNVSREILDRNKQTVNNIRLWDYRPLLKTYNEIQIFRTYYNFNDVDIDRYQIGNETRQVMLSPREIDFEALPENSKSWINKHLVFTHGFGIAMSPTSQVTEEGLPKLIVKDIPPKSEHINITQPRIYYGENTNYYSIVNTKTDELDYPSGDNNVYNNYQGKGGVKIDTFLKKLTYAFKFGSTNLYFSDSITQKSRIQFHRNIQERIKTITPFLQLDKDPYITIADGELYWIYDAYTTTNNYPYSQRSYFKNEQTNYVRNSVKITINAHTGETNYYKTPNKDPIIETYDKIFPQVFKNFNEMPQSLQDHVRYPEDLFTKQSDMYLDYHMTNPRVFYNKEDQWRKPNEILRGNEVEMEPYYVLMKLPNKEQLEFIQIMPFIPRSKENLIGWMAARSDAENYGELIAYKFPKDQLVYGPMQVESRIDQNTEISQRITLWSQSGSQVLRGNLLPIPIENTLTYVEPLFLQSRDQGSLPQLKRVIVSQQDKLTMQNTLEQSLNTLFGEEQRTVPEQPTRTTQPISDEKISNIRTIYKEARQALKDGDFNTYSQKITQIGKELNQTE